LSRTAAQPRRGARKKEIYQHLLDVLGSAGVEDPGRLSVVAFGDLPDAEPARSHIGTEKCALVLPSAEFG
jgi:hypothetical protein